MARPFGSKSSFLRICCRKGHSRKPENISVRPNGDLRCLECERANKRKCRYGLDEKAWDALFDSQGRCCAACKSPTTKGRDWHTDHSHRTNKNRGILCDNCNRALGNVEDSLERLQALIDYLKRTEYGVALDN